MTNIVRENISTISSMLCKMVKFPGSFRKVLFASALVATCISVLVYQILDPSVPVQGSIARLIASATIWTRDKPDAGETIAGIVQENLEKSAPVVQLTSAPVSSDCKQVNQLTSATALVGDRLAIRVFERDALKPVTMSVGTSPIYFERLDLSGTYEVDAQGEVSLPLVGRIKAEGRSIACLEAVIAERHAKTFSMPASVSAAFASRAPVLVAGAVRDEGSYNYTQGMTLRHVLALAGASPSQSTRAADVALMARKEELDDLMEGNRLKMLALASARAGSATMPMNKVQHIDPNLTVGNDRLEIEAANLRARVEAQSRKQKELTAHIEGGRARIELLIEEKARLERHTMNQQARLKDLRDLNARGITPASRLSADEAILTTLERALFEIKSQLLQAESKLEADVRALDALADENEQAIAAEMREGAEEADAIKAQLAAIQFQLNSRPQGISGASSAIAHRYTIVRTTTQGTARSEANLESAILPGDIVEIEILDQRVAGLN
jgi:polysaccharide export outer membrane protein